MGSGGPWCGRRLACIPVAGEGRGCGALVGGRSYAALGAEMKTITSTPHSLAEMGVLASESVATHFEQGDHIGRLESHYR